MICIERNSVMYSDKQPDLFDFLSSATKVFDEYTSLDHEERVEEIILGGGQPNCQSTSPQSCDTNAEHVEIFTDAAWDNEGGYTAGVAYKEGHSLWAWFQSCHSSSPGQAETRALLAAAQVAKDLELVFRCLIF